MTDILVKIAIIATVWIVGRLLLERATAPARGLHLTVFTPWRGDGWPRGVQEDDDARFAWGPKPAPIAVPAPVRRARVASSRREAAPVEPELAEVMDAPASWLAGSDQPEVTRVSGVKVHGPRH